MKVNIDMENLENLIKTTMEENIEKVVKNEINKVVSKTIESKSKAAIEEIVSMKMVDFINEYIETSKITVGGGFYSKEEAKTYTISEYIKKELADSLSKGKLKIKSNDRYGDGFKDVTFEEFIKQSFDIEGAIKKELESFMSKTKKEINSKIDETFTDVTKNMLSETVFNVLMKNDTFAKIKDNVKCIADKKG